MSLTGEKRRHAVGGKLCWCGSSHTWELAKHGYCECTALTCTRIHRTEKPHRMYRVRKGGRA